MDEKFAVDKQTGVEYKIEKEKYYDFLAAVLSSIYLISVLIFLLWLLFDVWFKNYRLLSLLGYLKTDSLNTPIFRVIAFTFIGGCLGSTISGIRSIIFWHCENKAFGLRFIFKHFSQPWIGGTLALFVFTIICSGIGILGVEFGSTDTITRQNLSFFAIGVLSGFGARQVYKWIDAHVDRFFKVSLNESISKIPDLKGMTKEEAEKYLKTFSLKTGKESFRTAKNDEKKGVIVTQDPLPGKKITKNKNVAITISK